MTDNPENLPVFCGSNVIVTRIGDTGFETYKPANLVVYSMGKNDEKGWIVARNLAGNALVINAMIPGGLIINTDDSCAICVAKLASLSYISKAGKPIPTIWKFRFTNPSDYDAFYGLLRVFSRLALEVNRNVSFDKQPTKPPQQIQSLAATRRIPLQPIETNQRKTSKAKKILKESKRIFFSPALTAV